MAYHIIIATERRTPVETPLGTDYSRLAIASGDLLHTCNDHGIFEVDGVLHTRRKLRDGTTEIKPLDLASDQIVMVAEWDLRSPYVILHKGTYVPHFAGWPTLTKEEYDALPADPL